MKETKSERLSSGEVRELIGLEEELSALKEKYGISEKKTLFAKIGERYYRFRDAHVHPKLVKRTPYLWLCLLAIFGVNQFYAGHWAKGLVYLAFCWTGIPIALGFLDWMAAVPKKPDAMGRIEI